jgi:hypothetical protein
VAIDDFIKTLDLYAEAIEDPDYTSKTAFYDHFLLINIVQYCWFVNEMDEFGEYGISERIIFLLHMHARPCIYYY